MLMLNVRCFLLVTFLLIACPSQSATFGQTSKQTKIPQKYSTIIRFDSSFDFPWTYRITVAKAGNLYPINVELLKHDTVINSIALKWSADSEPIERTILNESYGATDPLQSDPEQSAWRIGSDENGVGVAAHIAKLTSHKRGLLVSQLAGFDHLKRTHSLFVVENGKLHRAWMSDEGAGPTWSAVFAVHSQKGDRIIYFRGFQPDFGNLPDQFDAFSLNWDEKKGTLKPTSLVGLYGVIAGFFKTAEEARQLKLNSGECFYSFWVLPAQRFKLVGKGGFALAAITTDLHLAELTAEKTKKCTEHVVITNASDQ